MEIMLNVKLAMLNVQVKRWEVHFAYESRNTDFTDETDLTDFESRCDSRSSSSAEVMQIREANHPLYPLNPPDPCSNRALDFAFVEWVEARS